MPRQILLATFYSDIGPLGLSLLSSFLFQSSAAKSFRFPCGSFRRLPPTTTHHLPAATPHVGQQMDDNCLGVSCFIFIPQKVRLFSHAKLSLLKHSVMT